MLTHLKENATFCHLNKLLQRFNLFLILFYYSWYVITYLKASCGLRNSRQENWLDWYHLWKHPMRSKDQPRWFPIHSHTAGEMACRWTLSPPKVPKVQHATRARSPFGRKAPIPSVVLIKRTIMLLEMVVCLLLFPCYFHQSWSNMIYSCVCARMYLQAHILMCMCMCVCRGRKWTSRPSQLLST